MSPSLRLLLWRLAAVLWMLNISALSTETFASSESRPVLREILNTLQVSVTPEQFWTLHTVARKSAHLFEFAVLGGLVYRSLHASGRLSWQPHLAAWTFAVALTYALIDEIHQSFVPGRGPSLIDCGVDAAGALVGIALIYGVISRARGGEPLNEGV